MKTLTLIMALLLILVGCKDDSREEKAVAENERLLEKEHQATAQRIQEFCSQYNALIDWAQSVEDGEAYTIELEEALIRADSRPVLLLGEIEDITKKSGRYSVYFTVEEPSIGSFCEMSLVLHCTPEQVKEIMQHRHDWPQKYAVLARVSEVEKVRLGMRAWAGDDDTYTPSIYISLEPDPFPDLFIAKGTCSALLFLPANQPLNQRLSLWKLRKLLKLSKLPGGR